MPPPGDSTAAGFDHYIGLGDSISIDDYAGGPGRGAVSLLYRNRDGEFPDWRGRDLLSVNLDTRLHALAADGATTMTVMDVQVPRIPTALDGRALATLTVGGNDLLQAWSGGRLSRSFVDEVFERVARIVDAVRSRCDRGLVVVGTVYDPTDGVGDLADGTRDREALGYLHRLNDRIRTLARVQGVAVADIHRHFLGHGAHHAESASPYHHADDPTCWYVYDIEPNARGAHEVRRLFWAAARACQRRAETGPAPR